MILSELKVFFLKAFLYKKKKGQIFNLTELKANAIFCREIYIYSSLQKETRVNELKF